MKIRSKTLKLLIGSALLSAGTTLFAQTNFTWIGASGGDLAGNTNWSPLGVPSGTDTALGGLGDILTFNGQTAGPVQAISNTGAQTGFSGQAWGLAIHMTANQVNTVTLYTTVSGHSSGIRMDNITNDPGSGSLILGANTANGFDTVWGGATSQVHEWLNNSANPTIINPDLRMRYGGGGVHTLTIDGTGDWYVTNSLITANNSGTTVSKVGTGKMYWTSTNVPNDQINSGIAGPLTVSAGELILKNSALFAPISLGPVGIANSSFIEYDDVNPSGGGTLSGTISGSGSIQVNSGTLTLGSSSSSYTGSNILTGGELIAGGVETPGTQGPLGVGGTISFQGGTLGFSVNNQADYSSRFDTAANQQFNIDTAGQNVTFATALASSGGSFNKLGAGTLTLAGTNTYTGTTTVSAGKLVVLGGTGSGAVSVANSAILGVTENGPQSTPASLTVGTTGSAGLEFNNVSSTTTPPIVAGSVTAAGGPIQVSVASGSFSVGSYPLFSWTSGSAPAVTLVSFTGGVGNLSTNGNSIVLNVTGLAYVWTGNNNVDWDTTTLNNWVVNGVSQPFANGGAALIDDTSTSGNTNIVMNAAVSPGASTVNSTTHPYTITSSGANLISGSGGLVKNGNSALTLAGGINTYTGPTTISGGTVTVGALANGGAASDIGSSANSAANLVLNGGGLQYTGSGAAIDRLFTVSTFGGTIDNEGGQLALNNSGAVALSGTGTRSLTLTGNDTSGDTLAAALGDNGGATKLNKLGTGTWIVTGNNTYSGLTTIANGTLQVGAGGSTGSLGTGNVSDNATLDVNQTGTVTINTITGTGAVTMDGTGTLVLPGNNGFTGALTVNNGTVQVGNGGATGSLFANVTINNNSLLIFNTSGQFFYNSALNGSGNVIVRGAGNLTEFQGNNGYTGWTEIDPGATFQPCYGNSGALASSVVTNNGTLLLERQDAGVFIYTGQILGSGNVVKENNNFNSGDCTLTASNYYTGGTTIAGGGLIFGDGATPGSGYFPGGVVFTNSSVDDRGGRYLTFDRVDNFTFSNNIVGNTVLVTGQGNRGQVNQEGTGTLTFTGTNTYAGGTTVSNGLLIVAGPSASVGTGPVTIGSSLILSNTAALSIPGNINGTGTLVQGGSGITTLGGVNTNIVIQQPGINGAMIASNGTLVASSAGGDVDVSGGAFAAGGLGTVGTLTVAGGNVNISAGTFLATLNKSAAQSNSFVQMTASGQIIDTNALTTNIVSAGVINYTGGSLVLSNIGPTLAVGDRFVLFSKPVTGGGAMPITLAGGYTFQNNLATDGSITVLTAPVSNVAPTIKSTILSGGNVIISATNNTGGPGGTYHLLGTNNIAAPLATWPVVSTGSFDNTGNVSLTNPATGSREFYILQVP